MAAEYLLIRICIFSENEVVFGGKNYSVVFKPTLFANYYNIDD